LLKKGLTQGKPNEPRTTKGRIDIATMFALTIELRTAML